MVSEVEAWQHMEGDTMKRGARKTEHHHQDPDDGAPGVAADQQGATAASNPDNLKSQYARTEMKKHADPSASKRTGR